MNTKKRILEKINKRMDMVNECVQPPVTFSEFEVLSMINEIIGLDLSNINEIYADKEIHTTKFKVEDAFRNALKKKGRFFPDYSNVPKGAML